MKGFVLFAMLSIFLTVRAQEEPYSHPAEQKAVKTACEILKLYYPSGELCCSDSIYDLEWWWLRYEVGKENSEERYLEKIHRIASGEPVDVAVYSSILSSVFGADACECRKYVAEFSAPYKGMIRCDIVPSNDRKPDFGVMPIFLFKFNENGEIFQFFQSIVYLN